jgi:hypothetical protein
MNDIFVERMIKQQKGVKEWAAILGIVWLALLVVGTFVLIPFLWPFLLLVTAGTCFGVWYVVTSQSREAEYIVTNGTVDIDLIIAKRRRRRIVSVPGERIESMEPCDPAEIRRLLGKSGGFDRRVMAGISPFAPDAWMFTYKSKKNGRTVVVFHPDEKVLDAVTGGLPRPLAAEVKKKRMVLSGTDDIHSN